MTNQIHITACTNCGGTYKHKEFCYMAVVDPPVPGVDLYGLAQSA